MIKIEENNCMSILDEIESFLIEKFISFPEQEYKSIKSRFDDNLDVITHRFSDESNKYKFGDIVDSDFGKLKIIKLEKLKDLYNDNSLKGDTEFEKFKNKLIGKSGVKITLKKIDK